MANAPYKPRLPVSAATLRRDCFPIVTRDRMGRLVKLATVEEFSRILTNDRMQCVYTRNFAVYKVNALILGLPR